MIYIKQWMALKARSNVRCLKDLLDIYHLKNLVTHTGDKIYGDAY